MIYGFYHDPCSDGMMAATIAYEKLGPCCVLIPTPAGQTFESFPDCCFHLCAGDQIYLFDLCFDLTTLEKLSKLTNTKVIIFDHHAYSQHLFYPIQSKSINENSIHDTRRSACQITWDHFFPGVDPPDSVSFVQDRDLWNWRKWQKFPDGKYFTNYFYTMVPIKKYCYRDYIFSENKNQLIEQAIQIGKTLEQFIQKQVEDVTKFARKIDIRFNHTKKTMSIVNSSLFISEIGHHILMNFPKVDCVMIWYKQQSKTKVSLRSREKEDGSVSIDVNRLALEFGGGGHKSASGFICDNIKDIEKALTNF